MADWLGCGTCDQHVASSNPGGCAVECNPGHVVHTHVHLSPSSINLVPASAGKVTNHLGLASHWPCVTDSSDISTYGLTALEREISTPPTFLLGMAHFDFFLDRIDLDCRIQFAVQNVRRHRRRRRRQRWRNAISQISNSYWAIIPYLGCPGWGPAWFTTVGPSWWRRYEVEILRISYYSSGAGGGGGRRYAGK